MVTLLALRSTRLVGPALALFASLGATNAGCTEVDYGSSGSGGMGESAATTGTGGATCQPTPEQCNGTDDDCDGLSDQPPGGIGEACGCGWGRVGDRAYAFCPATSGVATPCPGGTRLAVLESDAEFAQIATTLIDVVAGEDRARAFVDLRQSGDMHVVAEGWHWPKQVVGIVPPWSPGEPTDGAPAAPYRVENHRDDCAAIAVDKGTKADFVDTDCDESGPHAWVACESTRPSCGEGARCLLDRGCEGIVTCGPNGPACNANPQPEQCNDRDDDCDGVIDGMNGVSACGCESPVVFGGASYRLCAGPTAAPQAACGEGYRLAMPRSLEELDFLGSLVGVTYTRVGGVQAASGAEPAEGWTFLDGTGIDATLWKTTQPDDASMNQECLRIWESRLDDVNCETPYAYVCQSVPRP